VLLVATVIIEVDAESYSSAVAVPADDDSTASKYTDMVPS